MKRLPVVIHSELSHGFHNFLTHDKLSNGHMGAVQIRCWVARDDELDERKMFLSKNSNLSRLLLNATIYYLSEVPRLCKRNHERFVVRDAVVLDVACFSAKKIRTHALFWGRNLKKPTDYIQHGVPMKKTLEASPG